MMDRAGNVSFFIFLLLALCIHTDPGFARNTSADSVYVVKRGDTLSGIA